MSPAPGTICHFAHRLVAASSFRFLSNFQSPLNLAASLSESSQKLLFGFLQMNANRLKVTAPVTIPTDLRKQNSSGTRPIEPYSASPNPGAVSPSSLLPNVSRAAHYSTLVDVPNENRVWRLVLTGGPCAGKTTAQQRLATFFEGLGWKVYTPPETATTLIKGGVNFAELSEKDQFQFNEDLFIALLHNERVFMRLAQNCKDRNCIVICDRGSMDPSAYMQHGEWQQVLQKWDLNSVELRDMRYDQVLHLVTAADGALPFYTLMNNVARSEEAAHAIELDKKIRNVVDIRIRPNWKTAPKTAWLGHPCFDVIDNANTRSFDDKISKLMQVVCDRMGIDYGDRFAANSRRRRWLVTQIGQSPPSHKFEKFIVKHDILRADDTEDARIRCRGQGDFQSYSITTRKHSQVQPDMLTETRKPLRRSQYETLLQFKDPAHHSICVYYQLDLYLPPLPPKVARHYPNLIILETYTARTDTMSLPPWLSIHREVTTEAEFFMKQLSRIE